MSDTPTLEQRDRSLTLKTIEILMEYERALTIIAAFNDKSASDALQKTGSFSSFDEPASVEIARNVLKRGSQIANLPSA